MAWIPRVVAITLVNWCTMCYCQTIKGKLTRLCSHNIDYYAWEERFYYNLDRLCWESEVNNYILFAVSNSNVTYIGYSFNYSNTWVIKDKHNQTISFCDKLDFNLSSQITTNNPKDPSLCQHWNGNDDLYFQNKL